MIKVVNRSRLLPYYGFGQPKEYIKCNYDLMNAKSLMILFDVREEDLPLHGIQCKFIKIYWYSCYYSNPNHLAFLSSKKTTGNLRRSFKSLMADYGELSFGVNAFDGISNDNLNRILSIYKKSLSKKKSILQRIFFVEQSFEELVALPWVRIFSLSVEGNIIAFAVCFVSDERIVYYSPAYDEEYSKYSPGLHLLSYINQYADERGLILDLGKGDAWYKRSPKRSEYPLYFVIAYCGTAYSMLAKLLYLLFVSGKYFRKFLSRV